MSQPNRTVLITGGSGFIGRNLIEGLKDRYQVLAPPRSELDLLDDQAVRAWFLKHRPDAVIHSATTPAHRNAKNPNNVAFKNLRMFSNLAANDFSRFILLGFGAEYDERNYQPKMSEEMLGAHVPAEESAFSKLICSRLAQADPRFVVLRLFGVFGKYEDWEIRFISNALCKAIFGLPITLRQNRRFDYLYVDDLVRVVDHFLRHDAAHASYNVTPDESVELQSLAQLARETAGSREEVLVATPGMGVEYSGSNRRLRAEIPGLQLTPIGESVRQLHRWYADNRHLIRREKLEVDK